MALHPYLHYFGGENLLMASDDPTTASFSPVRGMQVNCAGAGVHEVKRVFEALADGGVAST